MPTSSPGDGRRCPPAPGPGGLAERGGPVCRPQAGGIPAPRTACSSQPARPGSSGRYPGGSGAAPMSRAPGQPVKQSWWRSERLLSKSWACTSRACPAVGQGLMPRCHLSCQYVGREGCLREEGQGEQTLDSLSPWEAEGTPVRWVPAFSSGCTLEKPMLASSLSLFLFYLFFLRERTGQH